jgi:predicted ATPase
MSNILIRNFGPIRKGYSDNEGWMDIKKVTVFIGNQGSGKSTIAKLISTLSWIEKALIRGSLKESEILKKGYLENQCKYQNIDEYFKPDTHIEYDGETIIFKYKSSVSTVKFKTAKEYFLPKIMYVPAERNFISAVRNVKSLKGLPGTLYTFSDEYIKAAEDLKGNLDLPINNVKFEYQKLNQLSSIVGQDYKIRLSNASSGFQSLVPLYIVTKYLAERLANGNSNNLSTEDISLEDENKIRKEVDAILSNTRLTDAVKQASLERLSSRYRYSSFLNIVEEPEQNLFPTSQQQILNSLLHFNNLESRNGLVMTTHSPYLINYLTLAVKAENLKNRIKQRGLDELNEIVPLQSTIAAKDLIIYQLEENEGTVAVLENYNGIPSDENKLNEELGESNELYARLLEIQRGV